MPRTRKDLGHAIFADIDGSLYPLSTALEHSIQKRGVATAMYVFAERETGLMIVPSGDQKPPGKVLWAQKNRGYTGIPTILPQADYERLARL
jgi:hypothetical protein